MIKYLNCVVNIKLKKIWLNHFIWVRIKKCHQTLKLNVKKKGVKLTDQRKIIAKVMSESNDHPNVDELYKRVSKVDSKN